MRNEVAYTLALSGSGVLEAHRAAGGQIYLEPIKVAVALLKDMEHQQQPLEYLNTIMLHPLQKM